MPKRRCGRCDTGRGSGDVFVDPEPLLERGFEAVDGGQVAPGCAGEDVGDGLAADTGRLGELVRGPVAVCQDALEASSDGPGEVSRRGGVGPEGSIRPGEWREGTSPSRSLRTVRDSLPSYGSHSPAFFCLGRSVGSSPEGLTSTRP